ncbi:MAG: zinc-dependent metalloprotease [Actinobacteria bacterium]|nr:zinc-dependent metalloprotease [Actinomycetota bacterium]MBU1494524.1 zinc-dependent metalloprotease [Actinomycetota bacterium]
MSGIHWPLAEKVARRMAGAHPLEGTYHDALFARRAPDMVERAAGLVAEETGLAWSGIPSVAVVSRVEWAGANLGAFARMLAPAEERLALKGGLGKRLAARLMGAEVGALVGVLSRKVLGQYELVLPADGDRSGDTILFVGGNVLAMERLYEFRPDEFRFWVALHECTHRLQFVGVPWMQDYFMSLVRDLIEASVPADDGPGRLSEWREAARAGKPLMDDSGLLGLLATPAQRRLIDRMQALMSLLEGHGHVVMDRIGARELVTQDRMSRVLKSRRQDPRTKALLRLTGLEMKMKQYELGERFIEGVERHAGFSALDRVWEGPEHLPTLEEISAPQRWLERVA